MGLAIGLSGILRPRGKQGRATVNEDATSGGVRAHTRPPIGRGVRWSEITGLLGQERETIEPGVRGWTEAEERRELQSVPDGSLTVLCGYHFTVPRL